MPETRRKFDPEFRRGGADRARDRQADRPGRPDLGINAGHAGNWVAQDRADARAREGLSTVTMRPS